MRRTITLTAAVLALGLAGCASQSASSPAHHAAAPGTVTTARQNARAAVLTGPTKAQFISTADRRCTSQNRVLIPLRNRLQTMTTTAPEAALFTRVDALEAAANTQMAALPEPAADHAVLAKVWAAFGQMVADQQNVATALTDNSSSELQAAGATETTARAMYRGLAQGYGFKVCGQAS